MRRLVATFFAVTLAASAAAVVVPTLGASAGPLPEDTLDVALVSSTEPLVFGALVDDEVDCDSISVIEVLANGDAVEPLAVIPDGTNTNVVYVVLPSDTPPGGLELTVECLDGEQPLDYTGDTEWAALAVTKVVDGPAPEGTEFTVAVECLTFEDRSAEFQTPQGSGESETFELTYTASGEVHFVYFRDVTACEITEPVNGGAIATTITPDVVEVLSPELYTSTVTNTFAAAVEPTFTG